MPSVAVGSTKTELNKKLQCVLICNDVTFPLLMEFIKKNGEYDF